ncbi:MAG: hypothetical protein AB1553_08670 [Nitrospirota bacterium]
MKPFVLLAAIVFASLSAAAETPTDTRLTNLRNRIERGRITGELTTNESARLKTKLDTLKHKKARMEREGMTPEKTKELDRMIFMLERETDRMTHNLERK